MLGSTHQAEVVVMLNPVNIKNPGVAWLLNKMGFSCSQFLPDTRV